MKRYPTSQSGSSDVSIFRLLPLPPLNLPSPGQVLLSLTNRLMARHKAVQDLLAVHSGRTFAVRVGTMSAFLTIGHDGSLSLADSRIKADVELALDLGLLLRSGWRPPSPVPEIPGLIHVSGDAAMAQTLSTVAKHWRPELEDVLAEKVGDVAAMQITHGLRSLVKNTATAAEKFVQNLTEFMAYETQSLTPVPVIRSFVIRLNDHQQNLEKVSDTLAGLDARLQALERKARMARSNEVSHGGASS